MHWPAFRNPELPELVFSAHSVPVAVIERGDPYQRQIEETVDLVMRRGGWRNQHRLCYQSKVGASKWLQPSLAHHLRDLSAERFEEVCVVPIAFVSDHVETLGEIDHEAREEAAALGIQQFEMTAGLKRLTNIYISCPGGPGSVQRWALINGTARVRNI